MGYVKHNALAGRQFASWQDLEAHLEVWMDQIADRRLIQELEALPLERFEEEAPNLKPLCGRPNFLQERELARKVHPDLCIEVDTNHHSVPWKYIGESVSVVLSKGQVLIRYAGRQIARHEQSTGRGTRIIDPQHYEGLTLPAAEARS